MAIGSPKLLAGLLAASLLINGVMAGIVIERGLDGPGELPRHEREGAFLRGPFNPRAFIEALPEDRREEARESLRESLPEMRPLFREAGQARRAVEDAMTASDFDADQVAAALGEARAARDAIEAQGERTVLEIVAGLDPEDREAALRAAYFSPRWERRGDRRGGRPDPGGDGGGAPAPPPRF